MSEPIYINGKFYAGKHNGVHRVADRLVREIDSLAAEEWGGRKWDLRLLIPKRRRFSPEVSTARVIEQDMGHTQFWEQGILPFAASDGLLVNLANLAPLLHRRKVMLIHDAQFFLSPESYSLHFSVGYRVLTPIMARTSLSVLTISNYSREMLAVFGISAWDKTSLIFNGVDHILEYAEKTDVIARHGLKLGEYTILFGSTAIYKNIDVVLKAFSRYAPSGVSLVIIGEGEERLRAAGHVPPPGVIFVGRVNDGELRALYQSALCLLFPSRTEGFGLPPLEAMLCSCPAIVAPAGALPEMCRDAVLYANVDDAEGWSAQILALKNNAALRAEKIERGRERALAFTWRKAGEGLMNVLLSQSSKAAGRALPVKDKTA
ncbi:MAG: glycosyltransferase family 1 protein [Rhizomicrobium sp.]|nr:glycosyltransferase family 1 protein [Rhizomicrobium sp.]